MKLFSALLTAVAAIVVTASAKCVPGTSAENVEWKDNNDCPMVDTHTPPAGFVRRTPVQFEDPVNNNQDGTHNAEERAKIHCVADLMMWRQCRMRTGGEACRKSACARSAHFATHGKNCNQLRSVCRLETRHIGQRPVELALADEHKHLENRDLDRVDLDKSSVPEIYKRQYDGSSNSVLGYHLMTIWTEPIYAGIFAWVTYAQMVDSECVNLDGYGWASLRLYPMDTVYNCVLFDTPMCSNANQVVKLSHGEKGFDIAHFGFFLDGYWWHNVRSVQCHPGL